MAIYLGNFYRDINLSRSNPRRRRKINIIFISALLCGALKDFMKAFIRSLKKNLS